MAMDDLYLPLTGDQDAEAIYQRLKRDGVLVIPDFVSGDELTALAEEYQEILGMECEWVKPKPYDTGTCKVVKRTNMDVSAFPVTSRVYDCEIMHEVADHYLEKHDVLNREIFTVHDVVGTSHIANDLHFDVLRQLKFFIYITDTTAENGAFSCVPGSHAHTHALRQNDPQNISYDNREYSRELPASENDIVSVEGKAGSLIIFDSDVFHRAGTVTSGERRVMRGHTRCLTMNMTSSPSMVARLKRIVSRLIK